MKITTFRSRSVVYGDGEVERGEIEVENMDDFWQLIKDLDADSKVDSVMIGLDMQDEGRLALDILLR